MAPTQNSPTKFCLFPERDLPFHNNPPVTLQYSPATPILNENPVLSKRRENAHKEIENTKGKSQSHVKLYLSYILHSIVPMLIVGKV